MKTALYTLLLFFSFSIFANAQSTFSIDEFNQFLENNSNLTGEQALTRYAPETTYYKNVEGVSTSPSATYLDSLTIKYGLTDQELELLANNHFAVTERLSYINFGDALYDIYKQDMPVFVSTDIILHALHMSYDSILMDLEYELLKPNLSTFLDALYTSFPQLEEKYDSNALLHDSLGDVDLYVTMAKSLLEDAQASPQYIEPDKVSTVWDAVQAEQMIDMTLFSEKIRHLDFSQFTVRGHYTEQNLGPYFKCMMWLGRMDFLLTEPPSAGEIPWGREDIRRMNMSALLLNELVDISGARDLLNENDEIITFMVGESDNLTPDELTGIVSELGITGAEDILDDTTFDALTAKFSESINYGQRILSSIFMTDPLSSEPDPLPVSFRLMGQRFIIDSYVFSNVVYDHIIYQDQKIWRPMPDPLDAMFALGNDDALPLLREQLDTYKYSSQLTTLRYLVDEYDDEFWDKSLYNVWLQALRQLNPSENTEGFPLFMKTAAWHQEKLNTQLASWAQLRHDNLLYAKQSYTGVAGCSYPHSYVEPYPSFYRKIADFAEKAEQYFEQAQIKNYFSRLKSIVSQLEVIAQKELDGEAFSDEEILFLKEMLFELEGYALPPFSGWFAELFYQRDDMTENDYVIADVHTQPSDESGFPVGRVLHVGVGKVNLGVFIAPCQTDDMQDMAFIGPVMSYYEKITENLDRLTDERWTEMVYAKELPDRPDWVNVYLADSGGRIRETGRTLPAVAYIPSSIAEDDNPLNFALLNNYPNPFNPSTSISYILPQDGAAMLSIYNTSGQRVAILADGYQQAGRYSATWNAVGFPSGIYFAVIEAGGMRETQKMMLVK